MKLKRYLEPSIEQASSLIALAVTNLLLPIDLVTNYSPAVETSIEVGLRIAYTIVAYFIFMTFLFTSNERDQDSKQDN